MAPPADARPISQPDLSRRLALALMVLVLLGAWWVRIDRLAATPPGLEPDTAHNMSDALRISQGIFPLPLDFDTRPEPAFRLILAGWFVLAGPGIFTARLLNGLIGLLAVALAYRATIGLLGAIPWRRLGGLVAAGALAAMMPHVFLSRAIFRAPLLVPAVLLALIATTSALHTNRLRSWALSGLAAGLGLHTYIAGLVAPLWFSGLLVHRVASRANRSRMGWKRLAAALAGLALPLSVWLALWLAIPDLYGRIRDASGFEDVPAGASALSVIVTRLASLRTLLDGLATAAKAYFLEGYHQPLFNTPTTPFLNPFLGMLAVLGIGLALWHWRRTEGYLLASGLLLFSLPGALSNTPGSAVRLVGAMPLLALAAGWGAAWATGRLLAVGSPAHTHATQTRHQGFVSLALAALVAASLISTDRIYHALFGDPTRYADPGDWLSIPYNYAMAQMEALALLEVADQPTYVPLSALDHPAAAYMLLRGAYSNVTTWARYGLTELPAGQVFYPAYHGWHSEAAKSDALQALLLPDEHTIVILPPASDGSPVIRATEPGRTREIVSRYGWVIATVTPRAASSLPAAGPLADEPPQGAGDGLALVRQHVTTELEPGEEVSVVLEWAVTAPNQPTDIKTFVQLIDPATWLANARSQDDYVLHYLYPSPRWQPGDVIPDAHTVRLPPDLPDGPYLWAAGAYVPPGQDRLPVRATPCLATPLADMLLWGTARLPAPEVGAPLPGGVEVVNARFADGIALEGYTLDDEGSTWVLTLYWRAAARPCGDYTIFAHAMRGGDLAAQRDEQPQGGQLPTWAWQPGELVVTTHTLELPPDGGRPDALYVGLYSLPGAERLPIEQASTPTSDARVLLWESGGE